ncbi:MAG: hypothetical protein NVS9B4_10180 [Candidatus Acidiferrum sp.]
MRKQLSVLVVAAFGLVLLNLPVAQADTITLSAILSGTSEVPPHSVAGSGSATVTLDTVANTVAVSLTFSGLTAPAVAGHIHCCAPIGSNAKVVLPFTGLPNATSGTFNSTFSIPSSLVNGITLSDFITGLESGNAYVNLHTSTFPGGEIRGQLPEPASLTLVLLGLASMLISSRGRRTPGSGAAA